MKLLKKTLAQTETRESLMLAIVLLWTVAVALLFYKLGDTSTWQSEDRWLEIANEMIRSGNYFLPTINGVVYFDKPLLGYWLVVAAAAIGGGLDEFALRLPSAIAALLALWVTLNLGRRLWSEQVGVLAAWILLTSFGFVQWGRIGEADMENLAATIAAVGWYWQRRDRQDFVSYLVLYLILAIGSQCKGLGAVVVPLLVIAPDLLGQGRWRRHLNVAHVLAVLPAIGLYLLPFWLATAQHSHSMAGLDLVLRENLVRYVKPFDHTEPAYTYLIAIPQYLFPWSPIFIAALLACISKKFRASAHLPWLLSALALIFIFFTASGSRRNYYILPILPYCALLSAYFLEHVHLYRLRRRAIVAAIVLLITLAAIQASLPLIWMRLEAHVGTMLPGDIKSAAAVIGGISLASFLWMFFQYRYRSTFWVAAIIAMATILWAGFFGWQQLLLDEYRSEAQFAHNLKVQLDLHGGKSVAVVGEKPSGRLLFYSEVLQPMAELKSSDQVKQFVAQPPYPKWLIASPKYFNMLPDLLKRRNPDLREVQFPWEKKSNDKMQAWLITGGADSSSNQAG